METWWRFLENFAALIQYNIQLPGLLFGSENSNLKCAHLEHAS